MIQPVSKYINLFFHKELGLRTKIFHVLATSGVILCVAMMAVSIIQGLVVGAVINAVTGVVSLLLLIYSARGGNQRLCYWLSVIFVFLIFFPSLFFSGGGYTGGMGFFFAFAVVYTVYMLEGWEMLITAVFELIYYSFLCVFAYLHPEYIIPFQTETDVLIDVIVGLMSVSIALGLTMYVQMLRRSTF